MSKQCSIVGCRLDSPRFISGYCRVHYNRIRRTGSPGPLTKRGDIKRECSIDDCHETATPSGACRRHWHKVVQPDRAKGQSLKKYGLDEKSYKEILTSQGGHCAICPSTAPDKSGRWTYFPVDHDHKCCPGRGSCGKCIRGLVCDRCNLVLGKVGDDIGLLLSMVAYLKE
jgi:hypothetical protein